MMRVECRVLMGGAKCSFSRKKNSKQMSGNACYHIPASDPCTNPSLLTG